MTRKLELVLATWEDTAAHSGAFEPKELSGLDTMIVHTAGFLLPSDEKVIKLAQECIPDSERGLRWRGVTVIPRRVLLDLIVKEVEVNDGN